ncbi:MAG: mandelate racemase/muconate lactonizing enzyme family protein, partial [Acetobacteraceae bacterium]|nr:mandelate racemase/muconate lactonizing enzyme family protein [Acetobacteraceae bacterium]
LAIGTMVKRDMVFVKVTTESGLVGWGESHHGRAHLAIATLVNTTLRQLVLGMDATDVNGVWAKIYKFQLGSHGMGSACAMAMSGIDTALWDIRGKAVGWPLYKLLGGRSRKIRAYAGGISLGIQPPETLVDEAQAFVAAGFKALKLRIGGDNVAADIARVEAVRKALGPEIDILTDANTGYSLADARRAMPAFAACNVGWLEEPFPCQDYRSYREARGFAQVPLAAGENHFTRFEFSRLIEEGVVGILQPDLSKCGGITEAMKIAAMASAYKLPIHLHTSQGVNMTAAVQMLSAIENGGYFEADCSLDNPLRDKLIDPPIRIAADGTISPSEKPGIGVDVDEDMIRHFPGIEGPSYV